MHKKWNPKLYSIEEASKISGLGIDVIKNFIKLKAIILIKDDNNDIRINSFGMYRLNIISELLDKGFSKSEIIRELDKK